MKTTRRDFLKAGGATSLAIALGLTSFTLFSCSADKDAVKQSVTKPVPSVTISLDEISPALRDYYDAKFIDAANGKTAEEIISNLVQKQVISPNATIQKEKVTLLAQSDKIVSFQGFDYSETELQLYALAYLAHKDSMVLLADTDFMGGDLKAEKVSGVEECIEICKTNEECTGFTFAKESHPNPAKKNTCFLKKKPPVKTMNNKFYTSAQK